MTAINDIAGAFLFGVVGGSVPGPILTSVFTEVLRMGFGRSFLLRRLATVLPSC